jgi:hypothetical protein
VRLQPGGDGLGLPVGKQIDRLIAALQIHDEGAVPLAAAPGRPGQPGSGAAGCRR